MFKQVLFICTTAEEGTFTTNQTNPITITLGFRPRFLYVTYTTNDGFVIATYDADISTSNQTYFYRWGSNTSSGYFTVPYPNDNVIKSIDSNGFTFCHTQFGNCSARYIALK